MTLTFGRKIYDLESRTHLMGVLNVTPDSFSDGGLYDTHEAAVRRGLELVGEGADFIDVGGESTRPGSVSVSPDEEIRRVVPVIRSLAAGTDIPISVDTSKSEVADAALDAGASIVNDISGFSFDPAMARVAASHGASAVLMHIQGTPATMQEDPVYADLMGEIASRLRDAIAIALGAGVRQVIVDPGIGFGKTAEHNLEILRRLGELAVLGYPVLVGPSRKAFIGAVLGLPVGERLEGTAGAAAVAVMNGANILRVHDVAPIRKVVRMVDAILGPRTEAQT
ncbi:MAG TPA: dihydropteroate synthase [Bacteroidota bacterium]|nr:dihydropteroate synthase [Bacteroidota bacterium]